MEKQGLIPDHAAGIIYSLNKLYVDCSFITY
jgi:hypothetical protein